MPTYSTLVVTQLPSNGFVGGFSASFVIADINGDGKADLVAAFVEATSVGITFNPAPVKFFLGDGAGKFTDATATYFPTNGPTVFGATGDILVADFNGDGKPDFFINEYGRDAEPFPGGQNLLILSDGTGFRNATGTLPQFNTFTHSSALGDINGDGKPDIYVGTIGEKPTGVGGPFFLIGDSAGHFAMARSGLPATVIDTGRQRYTTSALVDLDGDGDKDLVLGAARAFDETFSNIILTNDGLGNFSVSQSLPDPFSGRNIAVTDVDVLDINGDGRLDIVFSYAVDIYTSHFGQILIGTANGFVDQSSSWLPVNLPRGVDRLNFADMNGDGLPDMIVSAGTENRIWLNTGENNFLQMPGILSGVGATIDRVGDLNGDGRPDLVLQPGTFEGNYTLRVLLNTDGGLSQTGGAAADSFMGDSDSETFLALAGDDRIVAGLGNDTASGGDGNDLIYGGGGGDSLDGGQGNDQIFGSAGADTLSDPGGVNYLRGGDGNDAVQGGSGFDDANGNQGNDTISTGVGEDYCVGGKDNDSLSGGADYDLVYGNLGDDTCNGDDGDDIVRGGQGNDVVNGGNGNDFVSGDKGDDTMSGGAGADVFHTFGDAGIDRVTDFNLSQGDRVQLDPGTVFTLSQVGADTVINMTGGGQMTLVGIQMSSLTGNWIFGA